MPYLKTAYALDDAARQEANHAGRNYWWAYIEDILERLGLTAESVSPPDLQAWLSKLSTRLS